MSLEPYRQKRRFQRTPEPAGEGPPATAGRRFVVQKHGARRLHYDLRLELDGVLKSWAVPKGPCLDPYERRLAVQVEDHPLEYGSFEGVIPHGEYGAGAVLLWDRGTWGMLDESQDASQMYREGKLKIRLHGEKLRGGWMLVRMSPKPGEKAINWLLIKERDEHARSLAEYDVLEERTESVASGESLAQVRQQPKRAWSSAAGGEQAVDMEAKPARKRVVKRRIDVRGASEVAMPESIDLQLAMLALQAPEGPRWLHEIKLDGYRLLCQVDRGRVKILTRGRQDWTERFPELARAAAELPVRQAWLDGELVALLSNGASNFPAMQQAMSAGETGKLAYFVFDLLYLDGYDLRGAALEDRKQLLAQVVPNQDSGRIRYVDHLEGAGPEFFRQCCQVGLEGIISKRRDRPYRAGRIADWLKLKCVQREEFVIGGYSLPSTAQRKGLGALLVGYYSRAGELIYAGRVGTGFSEQVLLDLRHKLDALAQDTNPFELMERERVERGTRWVRPELVAQLEFGSWTSDGLLRYPSFQGLREDLAPRTVVREPPEGAKWIEAMRQKRGKIASPAAPPTATPTHPRWQEMPTDQLEALAHLRLTHPDRVLYPEQGLTKLGVATYYAEIADWVLPHLVDRPVSLVRCPEGHQGPTFFQKHAAAGTPPQIGRIAIPEKESKRDYLVIRDLAGLLATVQMGVLELHPWGSRTDRLTRPDRMILDLDPDADLPWSQVVDAARHVRGLLEELGLISFLKTSGGKGLHLVVPLDRRHEWDEVKEFSQSIAQRLAGQEPRRYTASSSKAARRGRIYIDYLRNAMGATAVAAYSTRARAGATVSTPLSWDELSAAIKPDHFRVDNIPSRLASLEVDPWAEIGEVRQSITARMKKAVAGSRGGME